MSSLMLEGPRLAAKSGQAKTLVILLHGYGANGDDLMALAPHWAKILPAAAFAAPHAPDPCAQGGGGFQWFPVRGGGTSDKSGLERAHRLLDNFISRELERTGLSANRLALAGFSQGVMMALYTGLRRKGLAAIIGFSGALAAAPAADELACKPPVLLIHGDSDPMIPPAASLAAAQTLAALGVPASWHISAGTGHNIAPDGLELAGSYLARILG